MEGGKKERRWGEVGRMNGSFPMDRGISEEVKAARYSLKWVT